MTVKEGLKVENIGRVEGKIRKGDGKIKIKFKSKSKKKHRSTLFYHITLKICRVTLHRVIMLP